MTTTRTVLCRVAGAACLVASAFQSAWVFHAWDAALHMGSPIRLMSRAEIAALGDQHADRIARTAYHTGLVLIETLDDTFNVMLATSVLFGLIGILLLVLGRSGEPTPSGSR